MEIINKRNIILVVTVVLFIGIIVGFTYNNKIKNEVETFKYEITPKSEEWKSYTSKGEMVKACKIPSKLLRKMTTSKLVDLVIDYPLLFDFFAHNTDKDGLKDLTKNSDAVNELLKRSDAKEELQKKLSNYQSDDESSQLTKEILEVLLSNIEK